MARLCRFTLNGRAQTKLRTTAHRVVRLLLGLAWILMAGDRAQAQPAGQRPARVVTRYALTAAPDTANQDPENWRLLGSNDGGATWTLLDARTNQVFEIRSQRRSYSIPNQTAFNIYRLQVDKWNRHAKVNSGRVGVELAEFELIGDSSTEGGEEGLHRVLTASCAHPLLGPPENAFDNDPTTRWVDFGLGRSSGCWIQCEYVAQPNTLVTNIRELQIRARLDALRGSVMGKGALIRSNLALRGAKPLRVLTGYALTSANDEPGRDPRSWRLLGSNDGGSTWTTLDTRQSEVFPTRFKRRIFSVAAPSSCVIYRLQIDAVGTPESNTQIGEIEPIYALKPSDAEVSIVVSARSENPPFEAAAMAFDGDPKTKWLSLDKVGVSVTTWIQWQCVPAIEGLPVINARLLDPLAEITPRVLSNLDRQGPKPVRPLRGYALTSAADEPARDPRDWRLLGSNDDGKNWVTLDARHNETFPNRLQRRVFDLAKPQGWAVYRLQIDSVRTPAEANSVQLSEIEPLAAANGPTGPFSLLISARGENRVNEAVQMAFDGDPRTKWLDFSDGKSNRASWVEWQYIPGAEIPVLSLTQLRAFRAASAQRLELSLDAVVVALSPNSNKLGIVDETGFQLCALSQPVAGIRAGDQIHLDGPIQFGQDLPLVLPPRVTPKGRLAFIPQIEPGQQLPPETRFLFGAVEGRVTAISHSLLFSTLRIESDKGSGGLIARVLNPNQAILSSLVDHRVHVEGVVQPVFNEDGDRVAGVVWAASPETVRMAPSLEKEPRPTGRKPTERTPVSGIGTTLIDATHPLTRIQQIQELPRGGPPRQYPVKLRGVITYIDLGLGVFYMQNGPYAVMCEYQLSAGLCPFLHQEGTYVELEGVVDTKNEVVYPAAFARFLGEGRKLEPLRHSWDYLMTGRDDRQWVQIEGVMSAFEKQRITLKAAGGQLMVWINDIDPAAAHRLMGSLVRVNGVCAPVLNSRNQRLGLRLLVPSDEDIEIVRAAPDHPFDLSIVPIGEIMRTDLRNQDPEVQLVKTKGIVTHKEPRLFFIQDGNDGLRVYPRQPEEVQPGDRVEVVGLPEPDGFSPKLVQAIFRKTGHSELPAAPPIDLMAFDASNPGSLQDATRRQIDATFLGQSFNEGGELLELRHPETKKTFYAFLPSEGGVLPFIPVESRIRLTGVFKAKAEAVPDFAQVVTSFELFLNSPGDIAILTRPPWWTTAHAAWVLGGLGGMLLLSLAWVAALRNQVRQRTSALENENAERKEAERRLIESEQHLRTILNSEPESVELVAADGTLLEMNPAGLAMIEAGSFAQVIGRPVYAFLAPECHETFRSLHEAVFRGEAVSGEFEIIGLKGTRRSVETHACPLRDSSGKIIAHLGVSHDITGQKHLEAQLRQSQKMEAVGRLAGGIAHDFNNMLTVINGFTSILLDSKRLDPAAAADLKHVHTAGERAANLTRQLLAFSRKQILCPQVLSLNDVCQNVADLLRRLIGEDVVLRLSFGANLPAIEADAGMIDQVLLNLAVNARDAMPKGGTLMITTTAEVLTSESARRNPEARPGHFVCLTVTDTGCGIPSEVLPRIFEPFFTTKEAGKGTGLGLAMIFGIVKQHCGWVELESQVGVGTTFKVFWPASTREAPPKPPKPTQPARTAGAETILLVEDENAVRRLAAVALRKSGYRVLEAASGQEALEVWAAHGPQIAMLFTDVVMPGGMTGLELAQNLRGRQPSLKVICASGYSQELVESANGPSDKFRFLAKPYRLEQLREIIRDCLDE